MTAARLIQNPLYSSPGSARTLPSRMPAFSTSPVSRLPGVPGTMPRIRADRESEPHRAAAWMLAVALCFTGAGVAGAVRPVVDLPPATDAPVSPAPVVPVQELSMTDLTDAPDETAAAAGPPEAPPAPQEQSPPDILTVQDVFAVPPAAPIESVLSIPDPTPPRPALQPRREQSAPRHAESVPRSATGNTAPAAQPASSTGGGSGGTAAAGRGGKGKFPKPPYPAFAKAKGLTGTVSLSVRVSAAGDVTGASVSGSSGSSELDSYAASWVTRRWKWPAGTARSFRLPVSFRLR